METQPGPFQSQPEPPTDVLQAQPAQRFVCPRKELTGDVMGRWFRDVRCMLAAIDVGLRHQVNHKDRKSKKEN